MQEKKYCEHIVREIERTKEGVVVLVCGKSVENTVFPENWILKSLLDKSYLYLCDDCRRALIENGEKFIKENGVPVELITSKFKKYE